MTDFEIAARGQRAEQAKEFIGPILDDIAASYMARIAEIATTELSAAKRSDKLTALSVALKITNNIRSGLTAAIQDGEMAQKSILKSESIERMSAHKRRLFEIAPSR